jgi:hypothetical protein
VSTYIWFGHDAERAVGEQKWGEITFEGTLFFPSFGFTGNI